MSPGQLPISYLGDENLSWEEHSKQVHSKASSRLYLLRQIRNFLDTKQSKMVFTSLVQSIMNYADTIWSSYSSKSQNALQKIQNRGLRCIHNIPNFHDKSHHIADLLHQTGWTDLETWRRSHMCILTYKTVTGDVPSYLMNMIVVSASTSAYRMRSNMRNSLDVPRTLNRTGDLACSVAAPRLWNTFNQDFLNAKTLYNFKTRLRNYAIPKIKMFSMLTRIVKWTLFTRPMTSLI